MHTPLKMSDYKHLASATQKKNTSDIQNINYKENIN